VEVYLGVVVVECGERYGCFVVFVGFFEYEVFGFDDFVEDLVL